MALAPFDATFVLEAPYTPGTDLPNSVTFTSLVTIDPTSGLVVNPIGNKAVLGTVNNLNQLANIGQDASSGFISWDDSANFFRKINFESSDNTVIITNTTGVGNNTVNFEVNPANLTTSIDFLLDNVNIGNGTAFNVLTGQHITLDMTKTGNVVNLLITAKEQSGGGGDLNDTFLTQTASTDLPNAINLGAANAKLGIGVTIPTSGLEVFRTDGTPLITAYHDGGAGVIELASFGTTAAAVQSTIQLFGARGSFAVPTPVQNGDIFGAINGIGYDGVDLNYSGAMLIQAAQTFTSTAKGTQIVFQTTPLNTTTPINAFTILPNGSLSGVSISNTMTFLNGSTLQFPTIGATIIRGQPVFGDGVDAGDFTGTVSAQSIFEFAPNSTLSLEDGSSLEFGNINPTLLTGYAQMTDGGKLEFATGTFLTMDAGSTFSVAGTFSVTNQTITGTLSLPTGSALAFGSTGAGTALSGLVTGSIGFEGASDIEVTGTSQMNFRTGTKLQLDTGATFNLLNGSATAVQGNATVAFMNTSKLTFASGTAVTGTLTFSGASDFEVTGTSQMVFRSGTNLTVDTGAALNLLNGTTNTVQGNATLNFTGTSKLTFASGTAVTGTLTFSGASDFEVTGTSQMVFRSGTNLTVDTGAALNLLNGTTNTVQGNATLIFANTSSATFDGGTTLNLLFGSTTVFNDSSSLVFHGNASSNVGIITGIMTIGAGLVNSQVILNSNSSLTVQGSPETSAGLAFLGPAPAGNTLWTPLTSDVRVKTNIKDVIDASNVMKQLNIRTYNITKEYAEHLNANSDVEHIGFIAQEVGAVLPECLVETGRCEAGVDNIKTYNPSKILMYAFASIKELILKVEALEAQVAVLTAAPVVVS